MSRSDFIISTLRKALDEAIAEEVEERFRNGKFKVHGLNPAQVKALADKFRHDTGLDPAKCTPEELAYDGGSDA